MKSNPQSRNSRRHPVAHAGLPRIRQVPSAFHGSQTANHAQLCSHRPSPATRHRPNQSLAKHNRKPIQLIENKQQQLKSIASFCRVFRDYAALSQALRNHHLSPLITAHQSLLTNHQFRPNSRYNCAFQRASGQSNRKPSSAAGHRHPAQHETGFGLRSSNISALISRTKKDNA
jgi:hypothetical protein